MKLGGALKERIEGKPYYCKKCGEKLTVASKDGCTVRYCWNCVVEQIILGESPFGC